MSASLFTQEKLRALLDAIADGKSMAQATALAYGTRSKTAWVHVRNSRKEKEAGIEPSECRYWVYDWPEKAEGHHLCDAYLMALNISKLNFHMETLAEIRQSTRPVIEGGKIMYEVDHELIALYEGDADIARLCGVHDPFYKHDPLTGARIPLRVRDRTSAALTLKALAAVNPEQWDRPTQVDVTKKVQAVLTVGVHKPERSQSPLEQDLRSRLAAIRAAKEGERITAPSHPVQVHGRGSDGPTERTSTPNSDDAARPLPPPRALPPPQPQISYARQRPNNRLDREDAPNHGAPPPGGFRVR